MILVLAVRLVGAVFRDDRWLGIAGVRRKHSVELGLFRRKLAALVITANVVNDLSVHRDLLVLLLEDVLLDSVYEAVERRFPL